MLILPRNLLHRNVAFPAHQPCTSTTPSTLLSSIPHLPLRLNPFHLLSSRPASSHRWVERQSKDRFARQARVQGLKSRAAFKLLQINERYRLFRPGQTVVDLGYAPGSWSQVAIDLTKPSGRVLGVDLIPAQPPRGVSTIQGDFLSPDVQDSIRSFLRDSDRGRSLRPQVYSDVGAEHAGDVAIDAEMTRGYVDREREGSMSLAVEADEQEVEMMGHILEERTVDVVLSDMCEPWEQTSGFFNRTLSDPYHRMMNTSGNNFRDHAGSMDLCRSALRFSFDTLKVGGHFVCKFYQGAEDKALEKSLKALFHKVHREKPESSRSESKESYFVGIKRLAKADRAAVFDGS
ncbi:hypothetical protein EPUS_08586 [Endocarpon pusillum Z07020]|uniref:rRNA methyltransferase 2, mitochondrial n=1 Tax=Endocarpon pusillum (strain Z07020 / HMAS-L-300199) TaxID=1263415 RepID=U1HNB8_ENDPU|nr:uncharacterized protein EPUS_08586 [Endocarpon pusillum Z07020]ERF70524.1 hypothetical protein EPUS_08586 [Endocarpon pusillum Z07020]